LFSFKHEANLGVHAVNITIYNTLSIEKCY